MEIARSNVKSRNRQITMLIVSVSSTSAVLLVRLHALVDMTFPALLSSELSVVCKYATTRWQ
jgi:hypothetical protein